MVIILFILWNVNACVFCLNLLQDATDQLNLEGTVEYEEMKIKEEDSSDEPKTNNMDASEFHGFDETSDASGASASVVNQLVGKYLHHLYFWYSCIGFLSCIS